MPGVTSTMTVVSPLLFSNVRMMLISSVVPFKLLCCNSFALSGFGFGVLYAN